MYKVKIVNAAVMLATSTTALAGGILTNTNQSAAFLRNPARDGAIGIDGTYSNPAGVAFMEDGWHFSINNQSAFQTRTINSGITVPSFQGVSLENTPFYLPFAMNGGDQRGIKEFEGEASAPIIPSAQVAYNKGKWGFQGSFALVGGGGKCTFNHGLASFERQISMIPSVLYLANAKAEQSGLPLGLGTTTPGYSVDSYMHGQQYVFGLQFGATYKLSEHWAVYGGFRFNYIYNKYKGHITNIAANINGKNEKLYDYLPNVTAALGQRAAALTETAANATQAANTYTLLAEQAALAGNAEAAAQYTAAAQQYATGAAQATAGAAQITQTAQTIDNYRELVADRHLDCTQRGWAITPIVGIDFKYDKLNIGARLEFTTHFNIQNDTKVDDTGLFADGVNTPGDQPGIATIGAQYEILPQFRVMAGFHYFFDKDARMDKDKQKALSHNTWEFNAGAEYDLTKAIQVSAGMQRTKYGLGDGSFLNDMSFVTSSYSIGFGVGVKVAPKVKFNVAYFQTFYETFDKEYSQTLFDNEVKCTDSFTRTNKVFGVGVEFDI